MRYHNIEDTEWRKENTVIDREIESTIEGLATNQIGFGDFERRMSRLLSACKKLNLTYRLSDIAFDNYKRVYLSVKNGYEVGKHE